jgi:hypothetical protein
MGFRGRALALSAAIVGVSGFVAAAVASNSGGHRSLEAVVGKCSTLGGEFYVCPPFRGALPVGGGGVSAHVRWTLLGAARSSNGRRTFDDSHGLVQVILRNGWAFSSGGVRVTGHIVRRSLVVAAFAPSPDVVRGYAVWRLPRGATTLRFTTLNRGRSVALKVDGRRAAPQLVISPAHRVHSASLVNIFGADMARLAHIAEGNFAGACSFYKPSLHMTNEQRCAEAIGVAGKAKAIRASVATARFSAYNGWTLADSTIDGERVPWVLDGGHFRYPGGYRIG